MSATAQILRSKNNLNMSREKNENGSHWESVPRRLSKIHIGDRQLDSPSPFNSLFDLDRQFTQKLRFSDFNDTRSLSANHVFVLQGR